MPPRVRSVDLQEKRVALPKKLNELNNMEGDWNSNISKLSDYARKRMTIEEGQRYGISRFPNFHRTGSVRGMKRLYYCNDCLL